MYKASRNVLRSTFGPLGDFWRGLEKGSVQSFLPRENQIFSKCRNASTRLRRGYHEAGRILSTRAAAS